MNRFPTFISLLVALAFTCAHATPIEKVRSRQDELNRNFQAQQKQIEAKQAQLGDLSAQIHRLKKLEATGHKFFRYYRLQSLLREAQQVSNELSKVSHQQKELRLELTQNERKLAQLLDRKIDEVRVLANSKTAAWSERNQAARQWEELFRQRLKLSGAHPPLTLSPTTANLLGNGESIEELQEKLNAIRDLQRSMEREAEEIQTEVAEVRQQRFLRTELSHLVEEEVFFSEQGFVRGAGTRSDTAGTNLNRAAQSGTESEEGAVVATSPSNGVGTASYEPPGEEPIDSLGEPIEPNLGSETVEAAPILDGSDISADADLSSIDDFSVDAQELRDPLANLANELGLHPKQADNLASGFDANDSLGKRTIWLTQRLHTVHEILERLREKARQIELRLVN